MKYKVTARYIAVYEDEFEASSYAEAKSIALGEFNNMSMDECDDILFLDIKASKVKE